MWSVRPGMPVSDGNWYFIVGEFRVSLLSYRYDYYYHLINFFFRLQVIVNEETQLSISYGVATSLASSGVLALLTIGCGIVYLWKYFNNDNPSESHCRLLIGISCLMFPLVFWTIFQIWIKYQFLECALYRGCLIATTLLAFLFTWVFGLVTFTLIMGIICACNSCIQHWNESASAVDATPEQNTTVESTQEKTNVVQVCVVESPAVDTLL